MKIRYNKTLILFALMSIALFSCKKQDYRPGIPVGTTFSHVNLSGFLLDRMQVRIGPRGAIAGYLSEEVSGVSFEVPFADTQKVNRVVFYREDGSRPYTGSQIRFDTPTKDTTLKIFYDGKTFFQNPVFPVPSAGKMGLRITFKSITSYKGPVDLEFHELKYVSKDTTVINPDTNLPEDTQVIKLVPSSEIAFTIPDVKSTEFTEYREVPKPAGDYVNYAVYVHLPGTRQGLTYSDKVYIEQYFSVVEFREDYTSLITIADLILTNERPIKLTYQVNDRADLFQ